MTDGQSECCSMNGPFSDFVCSECGKIDRDMIWQGKSGFLCQECWETESDAAWWEAVVKAEEIQERIQ